MRHEHSFIVSPLVGPLLIGISPGIPCPVAPTALTSLAVNNEQTGFPCAQTLATASVRSRPNCIAIFRMGFLQSTTAYTTDDEVCRCRKLRPINPQVASKTDARIIEVKRLHHQPEARSLGDHAPEESQRIIAVQL